MPSPWVVEHERTVHADPWVTLRQQRLRTGRGTLLDPFDLVEMPSWVMAVPVLPDGRLVAVEQWRQAIGRLVVELPAGNVDPGEDHAAAALRELGEETGYRAVGEPLALGTLWPEPGRLATTATAFVVAVDGRPGACDLDETEDLAVRLVGWDELLPGGAHALPHAVQLAFLLMAREAVAAGRLAGRSVAAR
jgi:ADP-ribose pyrophosphatase